MTAPPQQPQRARHQWNGSAPFVLAGWVVSHHGRVGRLGAQAIFDEDRKGKGMALGGGTMAG